MCPWIGGLVAGVRYGAVHLAGLVLGTVQPFSACTHRIRGGSREGEVASP